MSDIQRWRMSYEGAWAEMLSRSDGEYVTYADHVEALRQAEQRVRDTTLHIDPIGYAKKHYEQGQRDALAAAVQRVEALWVTFQSQAHGSPQLVHKAEVIAALRGEQAERPRSPMTSGYWDGRPV